MAWPVDWSWATSPFVAPLLSQEHSLELARRKNVRIRGIIVEGHVRHAALFIPSVKISVALGKSPVVADPLYSRFLRESLGKLNESTMIKSSMFTCPHEVQKEGLETCRHMRNALGLLKSKALGTSAEAYIEPLQALLSCHEASLWGAVDFHCLSHLENHHLSCCRTKALLEGAVEEIDLPDQEDTTRLRRCLQLAAEAADRGGRPCKVSSPGAYLGLDRSKDYL